MKNLFLYVIAVSAIGFVGCKKDVAVSGVELNKTTLTLAVDESETLTATVLPDNATNKAVSWTSSNENVATVENGKVIAKTEGDAIITVTTQNGNKTATCEVKVHAKVKTLHNFVVNDIHGNPYDMAQLKGKKVLIVNVASYCGYTPHYTQLQQLYAEYETSNFVVIAFPCNDFGGQEPGTNEQILDFCTSTYHVTFPMMSKVTVKAPNKAPVYKWLTEKSENDVMDVTIGWNFCKFMIDEDGKIVRYLPNTTSNFYNIVVDWIANN